MSDDHHDYSLQDWSPDGKEQKTNSLNAYVTGVGSNSRIVLWDTTLEQLTDDEILFVMAHEMAHG